MHSPRRIASLLASGTEILHGLGLGERVVAVSHECDEPPEVAGTPRVTRTLVDAEASSRDIDEQVKAMAAEQTALYAIDVGKLASLRPELIVTQAQCDVCAVRYEDVMAAVETAPELSETRVVALNPMTLAGVFTDIRRVADAAGCPAAAEEYVASLQARVEAVRAKTAGISHRPRVVCIEWTDPVMVAGNWMPGLVELAGGVSRLTTPGKHSPYVEWDEVLAEDPEVIVVMPCGFDLERSVREGEGLERLPGWAEMTAVRDGRVYAVDGNAYFNRSGPRLVDSLEILAHVMHPELFDLTAEISGEEKRKRRQVAALQRL